MPLRLDAAAPGFAAAFRALVEDRRDGDAGVSETVATIIADVRARGDDALLELTRRFDRIDIDAGGLRITPRGDRGSPCAGAS